MYTLRSILLAGQYVYTRVDDADKKKIDAAVKREIEILTQPSRRLFVYKFFEKLNNDSKANFIACLLLRSAEDNPVFQDPEEVDSASRIIVNRINAQAIFQRAQSICRGITLQDFTENAGEIIKMFPNSFYIVGVPEDMLGIKVDPKSEKPQNMVPFPVPEADVVSEITKEG